MTPVIDSTGVFNVVAGTASPEMQFIIDITVFAMLS